MSDKSNLVSRDIGRALVRVLCLKCDAISEVPSKATGWQCDSCSNYTYIILCKSCGNSFQSDSIGRGSKYTCRHCKSVIKVSFFGVEPTGTAVQLHQTLARQGMNLGDVSEPEVNTENLPEMFIEGCIVVGGYGHHIVNGLPVIMIVLEGCLKFQSIQGELYNSIEINDIVNVNIGGPGATTTGGGFIGGGFGLAGALEGILVSTALNSLTTKTRITTIVQITAPSSEYIIVNSLMTPIQLDIALSPVLGRLRARDSVRKSLEYPVAGLTTQLNKLVQLYQNGTLSEAEFVAAKAKLLGL